MTESNDKFDKFLEENKETWKTKAAFMSWLRGGIRRSCWKNAPPKTKFIKDNKKQIANPNPRGKKAFVWGATCGICNKDFVLGELQVDHINDGVSTLKDLSDITAFVETIVVALQDELRFCCKSCHEIQTHAQKNGCSFEEARVLKKHILIGKEKRFKEELEARGMVVPKTIKEQSKVLLEAMLSELKSEEKK